jgi:6-phosphogluconolactonase (cycloisomerase 2 family)
MDGALSVGKAAEVGEGTHSPRHIVFRPSRKVLSLCAVMRVAGRVVQR